MSRPRTPTSILEARGAYVTHPERRAERVNEPQPDPKLGNAPTHLTTAQKKIWKELVDQIPPRVLTKSDRQCVERMTMLVERARHKHTSKCEESCPGIFKSSDEASLYKYMSQCGMLPGDRSKISVTPQESDAEEVDPMAEFLPQDQDGQQVQ